MEQIEETKQTSQSTGVKIYEAHSVYIETDKNVVFANENYPEPFKIINRLSKVTFLDYLVYGYIKNIVKKDILSLPKDPEGVERPRDIIDLNYSGISNVIDEMKFFDVSLSSVKLVYIDMEIEHRFDILDLFPCHIDFYLKVPVKKCCAKHLRKNIRINTLSRNRVYYYDFSSYINRAKLYLTEPKDCYIDIEYGDKQIAVLYSKLCFASALINPNNWVSSNPYTELEFLEMSFEERLLDLSRLVFVAKLNVITTNE